MQLHSPSTRALPLVSMRVVLPYYVRARARVQTPVTVCKTIYPTNKTTHTRLTMHCHDL